MKNKSMKQILFILTALFILGCSSDESPSSSPNKTLKKITAFNQDDTIISEAFFENEKEIITKSYLNPNSPQELRYFYNSDGLLTQRVHNDTQNQEELGIANYDYDNQKRLIKFSGKNFLGSFEYNYTYTENNTIVCENLDTNNETIYFINNDGMVYKEVIGDKTTIEALYSGNLIVKTNYTRITNNGIYKNEIFYTYNEKIKPKGGVNKRDLSKYGSLTNLHLTSSLDVFPFISYSEEFLTKREVKSSENQSSNTFTTLYMFDSDGFLLKQESIYTDGSKSGILNYEYN